MAKRTANARWEGTLKEGKGGLKLGSGAYEGQYSFSSRFEDGTGTNPEELIGAAHAGCFTMALNAALERAELLPNYVETEAVVHLGKDANDAMSITRIELHVKASIPGIDEARFMEFATTAKDTCIISRALAGVETMELHATLV